MRGPLVIALCAALGAASVARAQPTPAAGPGSAAPAPTAPTPPAPTPATAPTATATATAPIVPAPTATAPPAPPGPAPTTLGPVAPAPQWVEWQVEGSHLLDDKDTIRGLLADTMATRRALTQSAQDEIAAACARVGYQLVRLDTQPIAGGVRAILRLDPIPMVRSVKVAIDLPLTRALYYPALDEEVKHRLRIRPGAYLAWDPATRRVQLEEEVARAKDYLHDEGFFEADASISIEPVARAGVRAVMDVDLGPRYTVGRVTVSGIDRDSPVSEGEIKATFQHGFICLFVCYGTARFSRTQHFADLAKVTKMFQSRGFPAVKVTSSYDPTTSFDRGRAEVDFDVKIDQRRRVDVVYEGNDPATVPDSALRSQLTFADAASADDFEIASSAVAIQRYYQGRGWFDAIVTSGRERFRQVDHVVFRIDAGPPREVRAVDFRAVGTTASAGLAIPAGELAGEIQVVPYRAFRLLGTNVHPTADSLLDDADKIRRLYRDRGYGQAQVAVRAGPDPDALDSPAATGAALAAGRAAGDLYVRFDIDQGPRTLVDTITVAFRGAHKATCAGALAQIGQNLGVPDLARRVGADPCVARVAPTVLPTLPEHLDAAGQRLKDWFWDLGRPHAEAVLSTTPSPIDRDHTAVTYTVAEHGDVRIGKVVVRGNFRTRTKVILDELAFHEGAPLTGALYAAGPRRLRAMNLFSAVNVELLDFEQGDADRVNVVVRVEERYDERAQVDFEGGYTQVNNFFLKLTPTVPNLWGTGLWLQGAATLGYTYQAIEGNLRVPRWQTRRLLPFAPDLEVSAYLRQQNTPRFGNLVTKGASLALSRVWQRPKTADHDGRSIATTLRYDFRLRNRYEDTIRVAGPAGSETQAPVSTTTGAIGVNLVWDQRLDHNGNLNPLVPERGFRLEGGVALASPYLLGQDTFVKINGGAQAVVTANDRLQFHLDLRLDEGFPLGGAVLLPEVERFFAGGDTTVRGFAEDRLATELVLAAVPPFGNVQQIRAVPSGGNIRVIGSADVQLRVWKLLGLPVATALFVDAGVVTNTWTAVRGNDIRPSVGVSLFRWLAPFGAFSIDYAVPLTPRRVADNPTGFWTISVALRN